MNRRNMLGGLAALGAGGMAGLSGTPGEAFAAATRGLPPLKITKVKAVATCPHGIELIVVKVETSEPGMYGIG